MYKLLCLDLDGTLLDTNQQISEENKKAIVKALDNGVQVMLVSGRPNCFTSYLKTQIDNRIGEITFNGAGIRIGDISEYTYIGKDSVDEILKRTEKYDVPVYLKNRKEFFSTKEDKGLFGYDKYNSVIPEKDRIHIQYNIDALSYIHENDLSILKIFVRDDDHIDKVKALSKELRQRDDIQIYDYRSAFEIAPKSVSKGSSILKVCHKLGIKSEEVVCIGDSYNDISMFNVAGLSIAMDNAPEDIKELCDMTTLDNNHSGVAYAIYNYILK